MGISGERLSEIRRALSGDLRWEKSLIGLVNTHQRIRMVFGPPFGISVTSKPGFGTAVRIVMPALAESFETNMSLGYGDDLPQPEL